MDRKNYEAQGSCAFDIYTKFPGRLYEFDEAYNPVDTETLEEYRQRVTNMLVGYINAADECNDDTHYNDEAANFLVTVAGTQIKELSPAIRAAGLKLVKSFNNPKSGHHIRMYGYFREE